MRRAGCGWRNEIMANRAGAGRTVGMAMADDSDGHRQHGCDEHDRNYHTPDSSTTRHFGSGVRRSKRLEDSVIELIQVWIPENGSLTLGSDSHRDGPASEPDIFGWPARTPSARSGIEPRTAETAPRGKFSGPASQDSSARFEHRRMSANILEKNNMRAFWPFATTNLCPRETPACHQGTTQFHGSVTMLP